MIAFLMIAQAEEADLERFVYSTTNAVCASSNKKRAPRGALEIAESPLGWVQGHRELIRVGLGEVAEAKEALRWLDVEHDYPAASRMAVAAHAAPIAQEDGRYSVALEARAWRRMPAVFPNFTVVVDVSGSLESVHTRELPVLQDQEGTVLFDPVTRGELIRTSLAELVAMMPPQSKVSMVAMDAFTARVAMEPTHDWTPQTVQLAIDKLETGFVRAYDPLVNKELSRVSDRTFTQCHDNRVVILTDHVSEDFQKNAIASVRRWNDDDVEVWSFGVGVRGDMEEQIMELEAAAGGAAWVINSRSDARAIWSSMLNPGGIVHREVVHTLDLPQGALWRESASGPWMTGTYARHVDTMVSADAWSRVLEVWLPEGTEPEFALQSRYVDNEQEAFTQTTEVPVTPLVDAPDWAETRTTLHFWAHGQGERVALEPLAYHGQSSEVRAWMAHADPAYAIAIKTQKFDHVTDEAQKAKLGGGPPPNWGDMVGKSVSECSNGAVALEDLDGCN